MKLVGERRALAAVIMAFYFLLYLLMAVAQLAPEMTKMLAAIAGVYGLAFFALVAGYFWARWYAVGVGLYGVIIGAVGLWQLGPEPVVLFMGGTHLAATLLLWGQTMSKPYDGQDAWRERFHMDESAVHRLGRSVIRAGVMLPIIVAYAFAPREGAGATLAALAVFVLTTAGLRGLIRLRTWGVIMLGLAGALTLTIVGANVLVHGLGGFTLGPAIGGVLLLSTATPFLAPMLRFLAPSA